MHPAPACKYFIAIQVNCILASRPPPPLGHVSENSRISFLMIDRQCDDSKYCNVIVVFHISYRQCRRGNFLTDPNILPDLQQPTKKAILSKIHAFQKQVPFLLTFNGAILRALLLREMLLCCCTTINKLSNRNTW